MGGEGPELLSSHLTLQRVYFEKAGIRSGARTQMQVLQCTIHVSQGAFNPCIQCLPPAVLVFKVYNE